jgi:hypothetical protein
MHPAFVCCRQVKEKTRLPAARRRQASVAFIYSFDPHIRIALSDFVAHFLKTTQYSADLPERKVACPADATLRSELLFVVVPSCYAVSRLHLPCAPLAAVAPFNSSISWLACPMPRSSA